MAEVLNPDVAIDTIKDFHSIRLKGLQHLDPDNWSGATSVENAYHYHFLGGMQVFFAIGKPRPGENRESKWSQKGSKKRKHSQTGWCREDNESRSCGQSQGWWSMSWQRSSWQRPQQGSNWREDASASSSGWRRPSSLRGMASSAAAGSRQQSVAFDPNRATAALPRVDHELPEW